VIGQAKLGLLLQQQRRDHQTYHTVLCFQPMRMVIVIDKSTFHRSTDFSPRVIPTTTATRSTTLNDDTH